MKLLHESDRMPGYYFPQADVRRTLLRAIRNHHPEPLAGAGKVKDPLTFYSERLDLEVDSEREFHDWEMRPFGQTRPQDNR